MNRIVRSLVLASMLITTVAHACKFLVMNDINRKILVVDVQNIQAPFEILPGQQKEAGDPDRHVHYKILERRGSNWMPVYEFEMVSCAQPTEHPRVVMSELAQGTIPQVFRLMPIGQSEGKQLPAAQQKPGCSKCSQKKK